MSLESTLLAALLKDEGIEHFGVTLLTTPISISFYSDWLERGYHGDMNYLKTHFELKRDPTRLLPHAKAAIVVAVSYFPHPAPVEDWPLQSESLQLARYAQGRDYHHFLKAKMDRVALRLEEKFPSDSFVTFTDSGPVLERDLARRAGLGWVGKNTCLIDRKEGSMFFLSEIYTTIDPQRLSPSTKTNSVADPAIDSQASSLADSLADSVADPVAHSNQNSSSFQMVPDHCGTCTRCIDACPTGALVAPRELDARKCISYLTIEAKSIPPPDLREKIGDWFFGCDICQTVCPWNLKTHGRDALSRKNYRTDNEERSRLVEDLRFLLASPFRKLERAFAGTALLRASGVGLKRNALIVCANMRVVELLPVVNALNGHERLGSLAAWTLQILLNEIESRAMALDNRANVDEPK